MEDEGRNGFPIRHRTMALHTRIITPGGSTIEPAEEGGYRVCDRHRHCRRAASLWEAQELVHWAELRHLPLDSPDLQPRSLASPAERGF